MKVAVALLLVLGSGCGIPAIHDADVRPEIRSYLESQSWTEHPQEGPTFCDRGCEPCMPETQAGLDARAGWVSIACVDGRLHRTLTPLARDLMAGTGYITLVQTGAEIESLEVIRQQLEVEAPNVPNGTIRVVYHQPVTRAGRLLRTRLRCGNGGTAVECERLQDRRTMESGASYSDSVGWIAHPGGGSHGRGAGGLYWN